MTTTNQRTGWKRKNWRRKAKQKKKSEKVAKATPAKSGSRRFSNHKHIKARREE